MAKRIQEIKEEERVVSMSRPPAMNLSSFIATSSSTASSPIATKTPGMPIASGKPDSRMRINQNSLDAASSSQVRLKDAYYGGVMEKQQRNPSRQEEEEDSEDSDNPEAETSYYKGEPVAQNRKAWGQLFAHGASSSVDKVTLAIWGVFMSTTLRAAVHLGKDFKVNLRRVKNHLWKTKGQFVRETEKLISGQTETTGTSLINFQDLRRVSTSLLHSRAHQYSIAKAYVFSDSVLSLGKMGDDLVESWKSKIQW